MPPPVPVSATKPGQVSATPALSRECRWLSPTPTTYQPLDPQCAPQTHTAASIPHVMTHENTAHIERTDQAIDQLCTLLLEHDLADGISGHLTGLTCDVHLYGDQVTRLTHVIKAGLLSQSRDAHPSGATSNGAA